MRMISTGSSLLRMPARRCASACTAAPLSTSSVLSNRAATPPASAQISLRKLGIKLVVCDMAGTTVEEHGLVYKVLRESMIHHGLTVSEKDMHPWHVRPTTPRPAGWRARRDAPVPAIQI